jgi:hypothetical protein
MAGYLRMTFKISRKLYEAHGLAAAQLCKMIPPKVQGTGTAALKIKDL